MELVPVVLQSAGVAAGTAGTIGTVLSVGMTAASAFSSIQAGKAEAQSLKIAARQADLNARAERLEGKQQATIIRNQLEQDLASQNAIFAARGGLQGEGSAAAARDVARTNAARDIDLARFNSDIAALNAEQRASNARADARSARSRGYSKAIDTISSFRRIPGVPKPKKPSLAG